MMRSTRFISATVATITLIAGGTLPVGAQAELDSGQVILDWNIAALGAARTAEQFPTTTNLVMGMVHGAMYDAVVSITGGYRPYLGALDAADGASPTAAAAAAAHGVLVGLYPDQSEALSAALATSLEAVPDGAEEDAGVTVGEAAAAAMLAARAGDGRGGPNPLTYGEGPGDYRPTPPDFREYPDAGVALVRMFVADSAEDYRTAGPLPLDSAQYAAEFDEVKSLGAKDSVTRTDEQTRIGVFWAGAIPQWASAERMLAADHDLDVVEAARLFAAANLAAADASIACHADKYHWMFWRPITAIREAATDGNDATEADPDWIDYFEGNPPYPDHPSGFNCYSGAHIGTLRSFFGSDDLSFSVIDLEGGEPRSYTSLTQAQTEIIDARIFIGLHFRTADVQGMELGHQAAALAMERLAPAD